jgi:hypothetical protein
MMDVFSFIVLESTLDELVTTELLWEGNPRIDECVTVIRACMKLMAMDRTNSDYTQKIRQALTELSKIARDNGKITAATSLDTVVNRLDAPGDHSQLSFPDAVPIDP